MNYVKTCFFFSIHQICRRTRIFFFVQNLPWQANCIIAFKKRNEREGGINANKKRINRIDGCGAVRSCFYKALPFPVAWACDSSKTLSLFLYILICVCDTTAHQTNCLSNHVIYHACTVYRISRYDIYSELLCVYGAWCGKID